MPSQAHPRGPAPTGADLSRSPISTVVRSARDRAPGSRTSERDLVGVVDDVLLGDEHAWGELWLRVVPIIDRVTARRRFASALNRDDDERRQVSLRVMESLRASAFRRLHAFRDSIVDRESSSFEAWITTVAIRATIDHVRAHAELMQAGGAPGWVRLVGLLDHHRDFGSDPRSELEARDLLGRARWVLSPVQYEGLVLRITGHDDAEIAQRLDVDDEAAADRVVRAGIKRLRQHARGRG